MLKRSLLVLCLVVFASAGALPALAATTILVHPGSMNGWAFAQENQPTGTGSMVTGPAPAPLGTSSARLMVDSTGQEVLYTTSYAGTPLSSLTSLQYRAYRSTPDAGNNLAVSLQMDVNYDLRGVGNAFEGRLVFEPYRTAGAGGTIMEDEWFTWNALEGRWWATKSPGLETCPQASPCTWDQVLTAFPYAGIRGAAGALLFKAGGPWAGGFSGNVDAFTIGISGVETTYDFELETGNPPGTTIDTAPASLTNDPDPGFTFSGTDEFTPAGELTFECQLDEGSWEACTSPISYSDLLDGSHSFQVRAIDPAGLVDPSPASHAWEIDTQAPVTEDLVISLDPVPAGALTPFQASIDDTAQGAHDIASAGYTTDGGLNWTSLPASDCDFDSPLEQVEGSLTAPQEGTLELCLRGSDVAGNIGEGVCTTLTIDTPPVVEAGGPYSGQEGSPVSLNAEASDLPGSTLGIQWTYTPGSEVDGGAGCTFSDPTALETTVTCDDDGAYALEISVKDPLNPPVTAQAELTLGNADPQVEIESPVEGEEFYFGEPVLLETNLSDPGGNDTHSCQFDWGDGSLPEDSQTCGGEKTYAAPGDYTLQVTVTDDDGASGSAQVNITVLNEINLPPAVGAGGPYQGTEGQAVQLQGYASDPEQGALAILWTYAPGLDVDAGASCTFEDPTAQNTTVSCDDDGTYTLQLSATDGINPPVVAQAELTVANAEPQVEISTPTEGEEFTFGALVQVQATHNDPGANDTYTCTIDWGDASQPASAQEDCNGEHTYTTPGTYSITVEAGDDDGSVGSDQVQITVLEPVNQAPTAGSGGPYHGKEGQAVQLKGTASDPEHDALTYAWSYQTKSNVQAGTTCSFGNQAALQTSFTCNDNGVIELTLTVSDGSHPPVTAKTTAAIANQPPNLTIVKPAQDSRFFAGAPADLTAMYQDVSTNDSVTCQVDWGVNADALAPQLAGSCQGSHSYELPGVYTIEVTAIDDDSGAGSARVTITVIEEVEAGSWIFIPVVIH